MEDIFIMSRKGKKNISVRLKRNYGNYIENGFSLLSYKLLLINFLRNRSKPACNRVGYIYAMQLTKAKLNEANIPDTYKPITNQ